MTNDEEHKKFTQEQWEEIQDARLVLHRSGGTRDVKAKVLAGVLGTLFGGPWGGFGAVALVEYASAHAIKDAKATLAKYQVKEWDR
jgi:hypothetical protein